MFFSSKVHNHSLLLNFLCTCFFCQGLRYIPSTNELMNRDIMFTPLIMYDYVTSKTPNTSTLVLLISHLSFFIPLIQSYPLLFIVLYGYSTHSVSLSLLSLASLFTCLVCFPGPPSLQCLPFSSHSTFFPCLLKFPDAANFPSLYFPGVIIYTLSFLSLHYLPFSLSAVLTVSTLLPCYLLLLVLVAFIPTEQITL